MVAYGDGAQYLATSPSAVQRLTAEVTSDFWRISGARPALGRLFGAGARDVAVLSDQVFAQQFHRDPSLIGKQVTLMGQPVTIIGVLPAGFRSFLPQARTGIGLIAGSQETEVYVPNPIEWEPLEAGEPGR